MLVVFDGARARVERRPDGSGPSRTPSIATPSRQGRGQMTTRTVYPGAEESPAQPTGDNTSQRAVSVRTAQVDNDEIGPAATVVKEEAQVIDVDALFNNGYGA